MKTNSKKPYMYDYQNVMYEYKVCRTKAYEMIRNARRELIRSGYKTIQGRIPSNFMHEYYK